MIIVCFDVDESALNVRSPELETPAVVQENLFEMPVSLIVDGVNILRLPNGETVSLPLVGFSWKSLRALQRLTRGGVESVAISDAGTLFFRESSGRVRISINGSSDDASADVIETLEAFRNFSSDIKRFFEARMPSMKRHPQWHEFFPDMRSTP